MERVSTTPGGLDFPLLNDFNRLYIKKQISTSEGLKSLAYQLKNIITQHFQDRYVHNC